MPRWLNGGAPPAREKRTEGFTKLVPSVLTLAAMAGSMYLLGSYTDGIVKALSYAFEDVAVRPG